MIKIKNAKPKNMLGSKVITYNHSDGRFGMAIQDRYDQSGIQTNYSQGPDLPEFKTEIKSRKKDAWAPITVGTATINKIISTNGLVFLEKLDLWDYYTVNVEPVDSSVATISDTEHLDWSLIHSFIKQHLSDLTTQISTSPLSPSWKLATTEYFMLERVRLNSDRSAKLRIYGNKWHNLITMIRTTPNFNRLFEVI